MKRLITLAALGVFMTIGLLSAQDAKSYTLVVQGAMWGGCAGALGKAISSVQGAKAGALAKGVGEHGLAATTLELSGDATLGDVTKALEGAKTPHAAKCAPGVAAAIKAKMSKEEVDKLLEKLQAK